MGYRQYLKQNLIHIMGDKLVLFKPVNMNSKFIILLITPEPPHRKLFSYHAGPSGGHMGKHKTVFWLKLRFFWPKIYEELKL